MSVARWQSKATSLAQAWVRVTGAQVPNMNALHLGLAQAEFETNCGEAWGSAHNWGATDLRSPNAAERAAYAAGTLKPGYWLHHDGTFGPDRRPGDVGIFQGDSDPNAGKFVVWFAAFDDDVSGAAYYLRYGRKPCLNDPACTSDMFAEALYLAGYYGGVTPGARPVGKRTPPLNTGERANVTAYAKALDARLSVIVPALAGWAPPGFVAPPPPAPAPIDPATLLVQPWTLPSNDDDPPPDAA